MSGSRVGIVVPTRNRSNNVLALLSALERSSVYPEVCLIVDSSDNEYSLPETSFPVLLLRPGIKGQVAQRNFGIDYLRETRSIEYALLLDDDIVLEKNAIREAIDSIQRFKEKDSLYVGFSLNITNFRNAGHLVRRLLLHPNKPGAVTKGAMNSSLCNANKDVECDWVLGGAAIWDLDFLCAHRNNYPFAGKAYAEDLYFSSKVHGHGKFAVISGARCGHFDQYRSGFDSKCMPFYFEGEKETAVRVFIAASFPQYSETRAKFHILWIAVLGILSGVLTFKCAPFMLGIGRISGLIRARKIIWFETPSLPDDSRDN